MKLMKLMMLAIAVVFGTSAYASEKSVSFEMDSVATVSQSNDEGYVDVKFEDLNEKVQTAVRGYTELYDVTSLAYNAEKKLTKVTLSLKADQTVKIVILDDEGKETSGEA